MYCKQYAVCIRFLQRNRKKTLKYSSSSILGKCSPPGELPHIGRSAEKPGPENPDRGKGKTGSGADVDHLPGGEARLGLAGVIVVLRAVARRHVMGAILHLGPVRENLPPARLQLPVGHHRELPEPEPRGGRTEAQAFRQRVPGGVLNAGFRVKPLAGVTPLKTANALFRRNHKK